MPFNIGNPVQFTIRSNREDTAGQRVALPGIVVGPPVQGTRPNNPAIRETRYPVVSLRESQDGRMYLKASDEAEAFLFARTQLFVGLDEDEKGARIDPIALRQAAAQHLQNYLATRAGSLAFSENLKPVPSPEPVKAATAK